MMKRQAIKNLKNALLFVLMLMPCLMMAQTPKLAHVNTQDILNTMPEVVQANQQIDTLQSQYQAELKSLQDELQQKYEAYQALPATTPDGIKKSKEDELQQVQARIQQFQLNAQQDLQKKQQDLMTPIQKKIKDAISAVAKENGYTFVFDDQTLLYASGDDITNLVKKKLGLKM